MGKSDRPTPTAPAMKAVRRHSAGSMKALSKFPHPIEEREHAHCIICPGKIVESHQEHETSTRHVMIKQGYHCENCGIMYAFLPPKTRKK